MKLAMRVGEPAGCMRRMCADDPDRSRSQEAFSLLDVVFSMALVTFLFVSLYAGIANGLALLNVARENLRANQIIVEKMETLRLYSWDQINSNGFIASTFKADFFPSVITNLVQSGTNTVNTVTNVGTSGIAYYGTATVTNAPFASDYGTNLRMFTVTLNWTNLGVARKRELSTLVSQSGVQNYVYY